MTSKLLLKSIIIFISCLYTLLSYSQSDDYINLSPFSYNHKNLEERISHTYESDLLVINSHPKNIKKELGEYFVYRKLYISDLIKNGLIIDDSLYTAYFQDILNNILKANPQVDQDIKIFITRIMEPNAFNTGDKNIYFNIGLLRHITTEDEIAFVIAHELSHQYFNHNFKRILLSVNTIKSEEVQKKIKLANKQIYGSKEALKEISNSLVFDIKKHGRNKESEADSMAVVFLLNTQYSIKGAISALEILDRIDEEPYNLPHIKYSEYFRNYPMNTRKEWDNYNVDTTFKSTREINKKLPDSLKTHPDCAQRIIDLQLKFNNNFKLDAKSIKSFDTNVRTKAKLEYLYASILQENLGFGIHENIRLLESDSLNINLKLMLARNFALLNYNQRNRTLGYVLELPNDYYPEEYNYTLSFLNSLKIVESGALSYFCFSKLPQNHENEEYLYTSIVSAFAYKKFELMDEKIEEYKSLYTNGKYIDDIKSYSTYKKQTK